MRCDDIKNALNSDAGDLEAVAEHLKNCRGCAEKYAIDLELETALVKLAVEHETIDITGNLQAALYQSYRRRSRFGLIQKWVWIVASIAAVALLVINLPEIISWLEYGYNSLLAGMPDIRFSSSVDMGKIATEIESSAYYGYILLAVMAMFAGVSACLWREVKDFIR